MNFPVDSLPRERPPALNHPHPARGPPICREMHLDSIAGLSLFNSQNWLHLNFKKGGREFHSLLPRPALHVQ